MDPTAHVASFAALRDFRAAFLNFGEEVQEVLSAIDMEGRRTVDWLLRDQTAYWKKAARDRQEEVAQAKADLFRRQLSRIGGEIPDVYEQRKALRRAQERLREAEEKLQKCQEWARLIPRAVSEFKGPARQLAALVEGECPPAVALLNRILTTLEAYTALQAPAASAPAGRAAGAPAPQPPAPPSPRTGVEREGPPPEVAHEP